MLSKLYFSLAFLILASLCTNAQELFESHSSRLAEQWDLNDTLKGQNNLFQVREYKPVYVLLANYTSDINQMPFSDNPNNVVTEPVPLTNTELKFQLSFKTKVLDKVMGKKLKGSFWMAYTQTSRWQLYNEEISRPFRETNYEPEFMYVVPTPYTIFGIHGVFAGIGINHQSNGRGNPISRSWNRVIVQMGWETKNTTILLRPWWRIQESAEIDDNPGIENYIGRCELLSAYSKGRHNLSMIARHSLRSGTRNRGSIQLDYAFQIWDNLKMHTQVFHGYGESMIDFNHKQTTIGLGFSLTEWR
ncbi:phospholipase A [Carboxylicivirga sp. N1Y90]|uniref:phospholipase A n=1 Tax=Carboxylicivirga fragile TaxID=3417571 RepID=UPI003D33C5B2|nr:phospholipase A [Marinilabiliaceae bacterium N1Y90]